MNKIEKDSPLSQSKDLVQDNIHKLKELFPEIVTENKIDFNALQEVLGEEVEDGEEYYRFTWAGKAKARREAHKPSTGTLRPAKDESVDWETTKNLYIEGDNLEVLKLMQKSYAGKVKMIYIDPPYNTGKDFVYKDNYKDNLRNYQELTGQVDTKGNKLSTNSDTDGRYHSNWLNMMYPRLRLARNLLKDDGVIFMSIDDNEIENLKKISNEIFGEENFIVQIMTIANPGGRDYNKVAVTHEYILVYQKTQAASLNEIDKDVNFKYSDSTGSFEYRELRNRNPKFNSANRPNLFYPFFINPDSKDENGYCLVSLKKSEKFHLETKPLNSKGDESVWRWGKIKAGKNIVTGSSDKSQILAKQKKDGNWNVYEKNRRSTTKVKSIWSETEMRTENGTRLIRELFDKTVFDHPKPIALIQRVCQLAGAEGIFLDFFSGSSASAHGILKQNLDDGGNRKFIQVQLPEFTDKKSEAYKAGYTKLSDIGKERIRRAAKKIATEHPEKVKHLDLGFKVFKLDTSNIRAWDGATNNLEQDLWDAVNNIKEDRTEEDVLYEILLKYGLDLSLPIEERTLEGNRVFNVSYGALFICLADNITSKTAEAIGKWLEELKQDIKQTFTNPEVQEKLLEEANRCRVIFKDSGFTDVEKTNAIQTLKRFGIEEVRSV